MDTRTRQPTSWSWVLPFLAAIVAVLATLLSSASASAATTAGAETRVRASSVVAEVPVGPPEHIGAGQRLGNEPAQVIQAVATGVAANAADDALRGVDDVLGGLSRGKQSFVRTVPDEAALNSTFDDLARGGVPATWKNFSGRVIERSDGVQVGIRDYSRSGGPTIDIRMPDGKFYRIHVD